MSVKFHYQFLAVKDCILELVCELYGALGAGVDAELAEHTRAKVVAVFYKNLLALSALLVGYRSGGYAYGAVGAGLLAQPAGDALVVALFILGHTEHCTVPFRDVLCLPVLGVALRNFLGEKLTQCDLESGEQGADGCQDSPDV